MSKETKNVFENAGPQVFPVSFKGKIIGEGVVLPDGSVQLNIDDEDARHEMTEGAVGGLSINYNSKTIEAIQSNRKRKGI